MQTSQSFFSQDMYNTPTMLVKNITRQSFGTRSKSNNLNSTHQTFGGDTSSYSNNTP